MHHTHELRVHRRTHRLTIDDLAHLVGVSPSMMTRMERGAAAQLSDLEAMLALEIVFGKPLSGILSSLHTRVEDEVMQRALALEKVVRTLDDPKSKAKLAFLNAIASRGTVSPDEV